MKKISRESFLLGLVEFLFILLIVCSVLVNLNKKKEQESNLRLPGRYLVVMRWDQDKERFIILLELINELIVMLESYHEYIPPIHPAKHTTSPQARKGDKLKNEKEAKRLD